jgi:hypothetical protein
MASVVTTFITQKGPTAKAEGKTAGEERWTYTIVYQVETDDPQTPPQVVRDYFKRDTNLPYIGRVWRFNGKNDPGAVCSEMSLDYIEKSAGRFRFEFTFTPIEGKEPPEEKPGEDGEDTDDPLEWRKEISITNSQSSFPVEKAIFLGFNPANIVNPFLRPGMEVPVVNSAIVPFDPPPEKDMSFAILRIAWRQKDWDEGKAQGWRDLINDEHFTINWPAYNFLFDCPKHRGRIKQFGGTSQYENNVQHWRVELEIWVHPISWIEELGDKGTVRRAAFGDPDGNGSVISSDSNIRHPGIPSHKEILDVDGNPIMQPVLLDGNGQPMKLNHADGGNKQLVPVYLRYQYYYDANFNKIPGLF